MFFASNCVKNKARGAKSGLSITEEMERQKNHRLNLTNSAAVRGAADRGQVLTPGAGLGTGALDRVGQFGVSIDEQQCQQLIAAGDVPVHGRGHHPQLTRDRAQGQPRCSLADQLVSAQFDDATFDAVAGLLAFAHGPSLTQTEITALALVSVACHPDSRALLSKSVRERIER